MILSLYWKDIIFDYNKYILIKELIIRTGIYGKVNFGLTKPKFMPITIKIIKNQ